MHRSRAHGRRIATYQCGRNDVPDGSTALIGCEPVQDRGRGAPDLDPTHRCGPRRRGPARAADGCDRCREAAIRSRHLRTDGRRHPPPVRDRVHPAPGRSGWCCRRARTADGSFTRTVGGCWHRDGRRLRQRLADRTGRVRSSRRLARLDTTADRLDRVSRSQLWRSSARAVLLRGVAALATSVDLVELTAPAPGPSARAAPSGPVAHLDHLRRFPRPDLVRVRSQRGRGRGARPRPPPRFDATRRPDGRCRGGLPRCRRGVLPTVARVRRTCDPRCGADRRPTQASGRDRHSQVGAG